MGEGEYGGNGSVHWKVIHGNGRSIVASGNANVRGIDNDPAAGGDFTVTVEDVAPGSYNYNANSRTLTVSVPINHGSTYTRQVKVRWPQGGGSTSAVSSSGPVTATRGSVKKTKKTKTARTTAKARKKR